ncbi:hypothetical protein [Actinomadura sp. 7K507]|uniref:hypothetical protein n=1 Tax=Actinomadura sp. 7K507 TaxID=2530365 RepID=UPI00104B9D89|nr:hypothetical protein [Actinomadura sp. 7K507]TDC90346.1 hypothetical protein E1285_14960 [Actinomadura sp. 7K507]
MGENAEQYPIRDGLSFGTHDAGEMSHEDVKNKLKSLNPGKVGDASTAYKDAAEALAEMTDELRNNFANKIVTHWKGEAAQKALDQLGQVYNTAGTLSDDSHRNASLYAWYKHDVLDWYKTQGETMTDGWVHTGGDDDNARELMNRFIGRMKEAFDGHPLKIEKDLPSGVGNGGEDGPPYGGPGPGSGGPGPFGGGGPGGSFGGSGLPASDGASPFSGGPGSGPGSWNPGGDGGPFAPGGGGGPHLSGVPGGSGLPGGGGSLSGAPSSDLAGMPGGGGGMPGGGGGMPGGGMPGGGFGADPGGFGGPGAGAGGTGPGGGAMGAAGRGAGMRGGMPMGGMPMGAGGGQGGQGEERDRQTWLSEDEDVWGGDDDTAPPVIG